MLPNSSRDSSYAYIYKQLLGYHVSYWKKVDESVHHNVTLFENFVVLENLEKWTVYCFNVTGYTEGNLGQTSEVQCARTFEDAPEEMPQNVTVTNVNTTAIQIKWLPPPETAVPGIIRYFNISYRNLNDSSSGITSFSIEGSMLMYAFAGFTGLSLVEVNISAFTVAPGPAHTLMAFTEEGVPLVAPNITCTNLSSSSLVVNWTRIPQMFHNGILLGYRIFLWKHSENKDAALNVTRGTFNNKRYFKYVSKWTIYCTQVAGFTAVGDGPKSTIECTRTFEDAPEAPPSEMKAAAVAISTIDVEWSPPPQHLAPGILRQYNLTYRNLNYTDEFLEEESFSSSVTSYKMENLIGLTLYEINVTATTILPGPWGTLYVLTEEGVPAIAPSNVTWVNTSSTSIQVDWSKIPAHLVNGIPLGYRAFIWKESEGPAGQWSVTVPPTNSTAEFEGLLKYTNYCGQVEAFTAIGVGPRSPVECVRTSEDSAEIAPGFVNVSDLTWNEVHLSWRHINLSFVPGVLRAYRVTYRITDRRFDQSNTSFLVDSQFNETTVTGLLGFVDYEIMVNGWTIKDAPLITTTFKTPEGVPTDPPTGFLSTSVTPETISVAWQEIPLTGRHGIISSYRVSYEKTDGTRSKREAAKTLTIDGNTYRSFLFKLVPYTNYTISVCGCTSVGCGSKTMMRIETLEGVPSISPKGFSGVNFTGPTSIFISWGSLTTAELQGQLNGYELKYQEFSVADEEILNPPPEVVRIVYGNSLIITGLETYTTYKVTIKAISGGGTGVATHTLYVATCRCHKTLTTNYWNYQPYVNISGQNSERGFFPHLLDMVTLSCCQNCLEHGTTDIDYFHDGEGRSSEQISDIEVKRSLSLKTDYSFPVYGFFGQETYQKYYGYSSIVDVVGTVFFARKPDSSAKGTALMASIVAIFPFLAIAVIFAYLAGVVMWVLERNSNPDEFSSRFSRGVANGFWWAYVTMTTVGYGDKTARSLAGRIFAVVWILMGLVICSLLIGSIASAFTASTNAPIDSVKMLYGATVAALHDSPDHKLGVRRTAKVNKLKKYGTLQEVRSALLSKQVDGILIDSYVADSRRDMFGDLAIKQIIDLHSSYGVVMGKNISKIRKCVNKFWRENSATRMKYIDERTNPVEVVDISSADAVREELSNESGMYKMTLSICLALLGVGIFCGCIYEVIRRKKLQKVEPEEEPLSDIEENFKQKLYVHQVELKEKIGKLKVRHRKDILALRDWKENTDIYSDNAQIGCGEITTIS